MLSWKKISLECQIWCHLNSVSDGESHRGDLERIPCVGIVWEKKKIVISRRREISFDGVATAYCAEPIESRFPVRRKRPRYELTTTEPNRQMRVAIFTWEMLRDLWPIEPTLYADEMPPNDATAHENKFASVPQPRRFLATNFFIRTHSLMKVSCVNHENMLKLSLNWLNWHHPR